MWHVPRTAAHKHGKHNIITAVHNMADNSQHNIRIALYVIPQLCRVSAVGELDTILESKSVGCTTA